MTIARESRTAVEDLDEARGSLALPDHVASPFGELTFFDGVPSTESLPTIYDMLDLQTVPGKSWFTILRLYGPLESWFDKTWRPGEIEPVA
jgi:hypothetical protein